MSRRILSSETGVALLHVLLLVTMLTVLTSGAAMLARIEVVVSRHDRTEREAAYAAQAMLSVACLELDRAAAWNDVLSGARIATFSDGAVATPRQIPGGGTVRVCCGGGTLTERVRAESGIGWQPFGWQSLGRLLDPANATPTAAPFYVVAWIADDGDDGDGDPARDTNGRILVRAEAVTALGVRKAVESIVERAPPDAVSGLYSPGLQMLTWREIR